MKCPECQHDNKEGTKFCIMCGASLAVATADLSSAAATTSAGQNYCPECGALHTKDSSFCSKCGSRLGEESIGLPYSPAKTETSWAWWLVPIFFGWLGGLVGWLAVRRDNGAKAKRLLWLGIGLTILWWIIIAIAIASSSA